jgi:hypothetical protein
VCIQQSNIEITTSKKIMLATVMQMNVLMICTFELIVLKMNNKQTFLSNILMRFSVCKNDKQHVSALTHTHDTTTTFGNDLRKIINPLSVKKHKKLTFFFSNKED